MVDVSVDKGALTLLVFHLNREHHLSNKDIAQRFSLSVHLVALILETGKYPEYATP